MGSDTAGGPSPCSLAQQSQSLVRRFLELVDPSLLDAGDSPLEDPITQWDTLYASLKGPPDVYSDAITPSITVRSHPAPHKHLFSVQSVLPNIDARQFWTLMADSSNRSLWDSTIERTAVQYWLADEISKNVGVAVEESSEYASIAKKLSARVEVLQFGSIMFVANKRDMVLLCADTQLPSTKGRLRLLSASTSIELPALPHKKGYNRFQLNIGGFLVEDIGTSTQNGIRVTQVSDLGEHASWVPASIIRMVASTIVPKSMNVISKVAFKMRTPQALVIGEEGYAGEGDIVNVERDLCESGGGSWQAQRHLPPVLNAGDLLRQQKGTIAAALTAEAESEPLLRPYPEIEAELEMPPSAISIASPAENGDPPLPIAGVETDSVCSSSCVVQIENGPPCPPSMLSGEVILDEDCSAISSATLGEVEEQDVDEDEPNNDDSLASLFTGEEEAKDCTQLLSKHNHTLRRMNAEQREMQKRLSVMLIGGSDSLAMAIAPGARDSMKIVARIMNLSMGSLDGEDDSSDDREQEAISPAVTRTLRLASSASTLSPPSLVTTPAERHAEVSLGAASSTSSVTLFDDGGKSNPAWTSSFAEAPYDIAMGILNLASWIALRPLTSPSSSLSAEGAVPGNDTTIETSRSTLSALGVTRQNYLQRDAVRIARPQSQYRTDDVKLHPFPLINNENLPPVGIAAGLPASIMHCDQAKEASLSQEPIVPQGWWSSYL